MADEKPSERRIGWWPAAVALAVVVVLFFMTRRNDPKPTSAPPSAKPDIAAPATTTTVAPVVMPPASASVVAPAVAQPPVLFDEAGLPIDVPTLPPSANAQYYDPDGALPDGNTRGRPWLLEEKLAKTRESIKAIEQRTSLLEKEIADAEATGRKDEAAEKKVILTRLRARLAELQQSLDAGVDPTTPMH